MMFNCLHEKMLTMKFVFCLIVLMADTSISTATETLLTESFKPCNIYTINTIHIVFPQLVYTYFSIPYLNCKCFIVPA